MVLSNYSIYCINFNVISVFSVHSVTHLFISTALQALFSITSDALSCCKSGEILTHTHTRKFTKKAVQPKSISFHVHFFFIIQTCWATVHFTFTLLIFANLLFFFAFTKFKAISLSMLRLRFYIILDEVKCIQNSSCLHF